MGVRRNCGASSPLISRAIGVCLIDNFIPENPLLIGAHGFEGQERGPTTGGVGLVVDGIAIDSADAVVEHMERVVFPRIRKEIAESLKTVYEEAEETAMAVCEDSAEYDVNEVIHQLEAEMLEAAENLEFERAAVLRDQLKELKKDQ